MNRRHFIKNFSFLTTAIFLAPKVLTANKFTGLAQYKIYHPAPGATNYLYDSYIGARGTAKTESFMASQLFEIQKWFKQYMEDSHYEIISHVWVPK